jgi:regulator of protease activity HflC (stomatin/prohibitin superfamily)
MLAFQYLLFAIAVAMFLAAAGVAAFDLRQSFLARRRATEGGEGHTPLPVRWRTTIALALMAWIPLLAALAIAVIPSGHAGVRVSQVSGTRPGTLYAGTHFVTPLVDHVELFDLRDRLFTAGVEQETPRAKGRDAAKAPDTLKAQDALKVQAKEGLTLGLAITVRYQLDARRLDYLQAHLPQPIESELVPPVIASAWRELAPNYTVREIFSSRREEVRRQAAQTITRKLAADGIVVKEVMLRDIQLPPEYAKGLEKLLLKEQENDQMGVETEIQAKQVRIAELQAEALKVQQVKQAEATATSRVIGAKSEADAMQYTLPLKEKQIQQSRLEAEARKESTIKNAEAAAQAKVIDSKAETERRKLLADAEATRIRVTALADAERMKSEAAVLKGNPLLINKIVAERLSDKIQLMMVPSDGKYFFANDVFKGMAANPAVQSELESDDDPKDQTAMSGLRR